MNDVMRAAHEMGDVFFLVFFVGAAVTAGVVLALKVLGR